MSTVANLYSNSFAFYTNTSSINDSSDTISIANANTYLSANDLIKYIVPEGSSPITGLESNNAYYVTFSNSSSIALSITKNGPNVSISPTTENDTNYIYKFSNTNALTLSPDGIISFAVFDSANDLNVSYTSTNIKISSDVGDPLVVSNTSSNVLAVKANGNVLISKGLIANDSLGSAGQVLTTNGSGIYWSTVTAGGGGNGTVTSVASGNGLTGGPITTTGTLSVLANNGITSNSTGLFVTQGTGVVVNSIGVHVNSAYIGTLSANNTTYVNGKTEGNLNVNNATTVGGNTASTLRTYSETTASNAYTNAVSYVDGKSYVNTSQLSSNLSNYQTTAGLSSNVATLAANSATYLGNSSGTIANVSSWITGNSATAYSNSVSYTDGKIATANSAITGNAATAYSNAVSYTDGKIATANSAITGNAATAYSNAVSYVDGLKLDSVTNTSISLIPVANTVKNAYDRAIEANTRAASAQSAAIAAYSNSVSYTDGKILTANSAITGNAATAYSNAIAFAANASNITSGTLPYAQIPANIINTTANFTISGVHTHNANVVLGTSGLSANSSYGTAGHVLHSNGTATYWAADDQGVTSVASGNGLTGGPITTTGTLSVLANTGIIANVTGVYVNSTYIGTLSANNTTYVNGKTEGNLNVNSAVYATNAVNANNADYLDGQHGSYYTNATNISTGTLAEARLPYRMDQNVRTTDTVTFNNITVSGNLTVNGTTIVLQGNTVSFTDNMLYLNQGISANITNISGNGTYVTFTANNNYSTGWDVSVSGVNPSSYNGDYNNIFLANATHFVVANTNTASYVSGGTARGKTDSNPDLGFAAGYNDGTYHHAGFFRDASDGIWKIFDNYDPEPDASVFIDTTNTSFHLANFQANVYFAGNTSTNWFIANTSGAYHTGTINAASHTVGTSFTANATMTNTVSLVVSTNTATIGTGTYFVSNGNVGIGNSAPTDKLSVNGLSYFGNMVRLGPAGGGLEGGQIVWNGGNSSYNSWTTDIYSTNFRIFTNFDVGSNGQVQISSGNTSFNVGLYIQGNTGIGTPSPGYLLDVFNSSSATDYYAGRYLTAAAVSGTSTTYLRIEKGNGYGGTIGGYITQGVGSGLVLGTLNGGTQSNALWINNAGNVGIGTTSPQSLLHVGVSPLTYAKTGHAASFRSESGSDKPTVVIETGSDGSTTDESGLVVFQRGTSFGGNNSVVDIVARATTGDSLRCSTSTDSGVTKSVLFKVQNDGNVGIGTSSPSVKLDVNGDARLYGTGPVTLTIEADTDNVTETDNPKIVLKQDGGAVVGRLGYGSLSDAGGNTLEIVNEFASNLVLGTNNLERMRISSTGVVLPGADNTQDLGSTSLRWANIFTGDLHLSNEKSNGNDVDGTTGNWTIQEGESELYIINNKNGKKFKFKLEEII